MPKGKYGSPYKMKGHELPGPQQDVNKIVNLSTLGPAHSVHAASEKVKNKKYNQFAADRDKKFATGETLAKAGKAAKQQNGKNLKLSQAGKTLAKS